MAKQKRRKFTPEEKAGIVRLHLLENQPVSEICDRFSLSPAQFYQWQKQLFENAAAAFAPPSSRSVAAPQRKIKQLEEKLQRKAEVLSELMKEHINLKKELGEA